MIHLFIIHFYRFGKLIILTKNKKKIENSVGFNGKPDYLIQIWSRGKNVEKTFEIHSLEKREDSTIKNITKHLRQKLSHFVITVATFCNKDEHSFK